MTSGLVTRLIVTVVPSSAGLYSQRSLRQKVPFALGQNVITGSGQNIQQFFYKHVGTYISVTPHIVNWGSGYGSGRGRAPLTDADVDNWDLLVRQLLHARPYLTGNPYPPTAPVKPEPPL